MPRPRTLPVLTSARAVVIGLTVGCALAPFLLAALGRGDAHIPPVAFISVALFCGLLIPRAAAELLPYRNPQQAAPRDRR